MIPSKQNLDEYLTLVGLGKRNALFLFFPNFEERSVAFPSYVASFPRIEANSQVIVTWLQGNHPASVLDAVKTENAERVSEICQDKWPDCILQELRYPLTNSRAFHQTVRDRIAEFEGCVDVIVDVSATPRDLLFKLFEFLFPLDGCFPFCINRTHLSSLCFAYTWCAAYPTVAAPELLGDLRGYNSGIPFLEFLQQRRQVTLVVSGAGTGHDSLQAVTLSEHEIDNHLLDSHVFFLLNAGRMGQSFEQLIRHQSLIAHLKSRGCSYRILCSIEQFAFESMRIAEAAGKNHGDSGAFVVGPFGPKPLGIFAYFAAREYLFQCQKRGVNSCTFDILDLSGAQYLSLYSLGVGSTEFFQISFSESSVA